MADLQLTRDDPERQFWDVMKNIHAVMLGQAGGAIAMRPMAPFTDGADRSIWFFTRRDTELFKQLGDGQQAEVVVIGKDHDYHASLQGMLLESREREKRDHYWNAATAAWFNGKDDPFLALLEFRPSVASIWASTSSALTLGWEIMKGNVSASSPDIGEHTHIRFHQRNAQ